MTATLGETHASQTADATAGAAERATPRRARRELAARVAHSAGGHRVAAAMIGVLAVVAAAGAAIQLAAG